MTSSIREYHQQFQSGRATPRDVIEESIARIEARNSELNAFISVDWARARREADEASERYRTGLIRGVLDGVPVGLKDLFNTQGIATTAASKILLKNVPNDDAAVVSQLHLAGANTRLGKLNLHEFAFSPTGTASYFGPMKNPHDPTRMAGGSSGGSGIAVATRMVTTALGTDTGGSVRIPAAFCGIYGLKPTYDRLSRHGVIPLSWTLYMAVAGDVVVPVITHVMMDTTAMVVNFAPNHWVREGFMAALIVAVLIWAVVRSWWEDWRTTSRDLE